MQDGGLQDEGPGQRPNPWEVADQRQPTGLHEGHADGQPWLRLAGLPFGCTLDLDVGGCEGRPDAHERLADLIIQAAEPKT